MTNTELVLNLSATLLARALAANAVIAKAQSEGRDVSEAELTLVRSEAVNSLDKLQETINSLG